MSSSKGIGVNYIIKKLPPKHKAILGRMSASYCDWLQSSCNAPTNTFVVNKFEGEGRAARILLAKVVAPGTSLGSSFLAGDIQTPKSKKSPALPPTKTWSR